MSQLPDRIGRYEVLNLLGQGGMGVLYLARDPVIDRHVALKLLKVDNEDLRRRFVREARSAGRLQHPNIVTVYDVGDHDGELFIAMEYIDGDTLATLIRDEVPFSTLRKLEMIDQLADGLGFAHNRSIVHRDIKPANLMVTRGGLLKVLDFGIARLTRPEMGAVSVAGGPLVGTPAYMAPEQLAGDPVDHRADIFAVGLVMYELLSGKRAFVGATTADVLQNVMRAEPPPLESIVPHIDMDLVRCVSRALAKRPEDRYQGLQELRNDLGRVRRRTEFESGSFDATIVVQLPPSARTAAPVAASTAAVPPVPPPPPVPVPVPATTDPSTAGGVTGAANETRPPHDEEGDVLRHLSSGAGRSTRPVHVPDNVDETMYVPVMSPPPLSPAPAAPPPPVVPSDVAGSPTPTTAGSAPSTDRPAPPSVDAESPTVVVPVFGAAPRAPVPPAPPVQPTPPIPPAPPVSHVPPVSAPPPLAPVRADEVGASMASPGAVPTAARRSVLPALIVLAVVLLMLVAATLGAIWWVRARLSSSFGAAATGSTITEGTEASVEVVSPDAVTQAPDAPVRADPSSPVPDTSAGSAASPPVAITVAQPAPAPPVPAAAPAPAAVVARPAQPTGRPASQVASRAPEAVTTSRAETPVPAPARTSPPEAAAPPPPSVPPPVRAPSEPPPPAVVPRDEALTLVRAYVAARNTGHAAGLRRVWPSVTDVELRRMTGEFSAPLTLSGCDVDDASDIRMRATCQFTQPGGTGFSSGTTLNIRRQLVFRIERERRGWVIVDVTG